MSRKHVRRSGTIAVRSPLTFRIQTAFMALTLLISLGCAVVPPVTAADFSGGVGIFLPVSPLNADNLTYWVTPKTKLAKSYGLQFVNLVVNWADLEPADDSFNFKTLQNYIKAVQGQGMKVVLRVYFNGGDWLQAAPNWLFDSRKAQFYYEGSQRQPVPWDSVYLEEMGEFAMKLGLWLRDNGTIVPDAIQISAGGIYGEQCILGLDWPSMFNGDYDAFYLKLMEAEKQHVNVFANLGWYTNSKLALMVSHLYDNNTDMSDMLIAHSKALGVNWFQTNSWSGELQSTWYGPKILEMLSRHSDAGQFFLEDEYGSKFSETVAKRLERIKQIEQQNGIRFKAVSLNVDDLTSRNKKGIQSLVKHVLQP